MLTGDVWFDVIAKGEPPSRLREGRPALPSAGPVSPGELPEQAESDPPTRTPANL
jgi:hypothetical protein